MEITNDRSRNNAFSCGRNSGWHRNSENNRNFCGVGLSVSLIAASYGLDLSVGFFLRRRSSSVRWEFMVG
jgi:hypothetical protein